ncbi:4Fe-4S binding protein [Thermodesulfatator autotrophicus]|uniref:Nitrate reductase n=1 Tax=Thermodesulfatator autotrophicus TaxID=1795632 RepID=A0A177E971_9BACT|nr:4Fe-4S binding protein [Thermodesulfatator autotrophicus]OAG28041.1 nitrate reductase [Thermodesulfatator autotrophicus]
MRKYNSLRFLVLFLSFLVILVNPFLNYYFQINFIQGWYQSLSIGKLWFVSPLEGFESILVSKTIYLPLLIALFLPVLLASFLGRVFCSWVCPISFLSEIQERVLKIFGFKRRKDLILLPRSTIWFTLIGDMVLAMMIGAPLFVFLSPPGLVGREIMMAVFFHTLAIEGVVILLVLFMNFFTRRFFCRYFCPLGGMLAFLGTRRSLKVVRDKDSCTECKMCEKACPLGLSPLKDESRGAYCWNCGACVDACNFEALKFKWRPNLPQD